MKQFANPPAKAVTVAALNLQMLEKFRQALAGRYNRSVFILACHCENPPVGGDKAIFKIDCHGHSNGLAMTRKNQSIKREKTEQRFKVSKIQNYLREQNINSKPEDHL